MKHYFLLILLFMISLSACNPRMAQETSIALGNPGGEHSQTDGLKFLKTDAAIIANLREKYALEPQERGGDGRCLFLSLIDQISQQDLQLVAIQLSVGMSDKINQYDGATDEVQAGLLREIAIFVERRFVEAQEAALFKNLAVDEQTWVLEMFKDWYQQFGHDPVATRVYFDSHAGNEAGRQFLWDYVKDKDNRDRYWAEVGCVNNWAGTSEAVAIARLLHRPLKMFGLDNASSAQGAKLDKNGFVLPYFSYPVGMLTPPLLVFQTGGGGHYRMLVPVN